MDSEFNPIEIWLEEVPACERVIAVDWHQVSDVCRYSRKSSVHIAGNGQVPQDISSFYGKVHRRLQPADSFIVLSHIEHSQDMIRTLEECCMCLHVQAGFAAMPKLWPVTCRYAAVAVSIDKWEKAFGTELRGANYAPGQLVFYRTKSQYKPKLDPNASPALALMADWNLEFGLRFKGVLSLLDYKAL